MLGHLIKQDGEWMVKYNNNGDIKLYPLCPETKKWSENPNTQKYIKENIDVVFDFLIKGEYCETQKQIIKHYFAKIKLVEHESI